MNANTELISIIMAAYNAEKTIVSAIQSVVSQTYPNWELLVINDCSKDNTEEIVLRFAHSDPRIRLINIITNSGVSVTREKGMEASRGAWIAVLDSDDMWEPDKLEKQLRLVNTTGAELVFTASAFIDNAGNRLDWQLHVPATISYRELLKQNLISNSSVLVRTALYKKYYAIGDSMHEDFAMWLAITKAGYKAYGIDEPLLIYRLSKASKSSNKFKAAIMCWNTYRYVGLNFATSIYYMLYYIKNGLFKYCMLKSSKKVGNGSQHTSP